MNTSLVKLVLLKYCVSLWMCVLVRVCVLFFFFPWNMGAVISDEEGDLILPVEVLGVLCSM